MSKRSEGQLFCLSRNRVLVLFGIWKQQLSRLHYGEGLEDIRYANSSNRYFAAIIIRVDGILQVWCLFFSHGWCWLYQWRASPFRNQCQWFSVCWSFINLFILPNGKSGNIFLVSKIKSLKCFCQLWLLGWVPKIFRMEEKSHALRNQSILRTLHQTSRSTRTGQDLSRHVWMVLHTSKWRLTMYRRIRKALFQVNISIVTTTISISNIFALISTAT